MNPRRLASAYAGLADLAADLNDWRHDRVYLPRILGRRTRPRRITLGSWISMVANPDEADTSKQHYRWYQVTGLHTDGQQTVVTFPAGEPHIRLTPHDRVVTIGPALARMFNLAGTRQ